MATYQFSADSDRYWSYVDFNVTPSVSLYPDKTTVQNLIYPGKQISISGQAYARDIAIKSIRVWMDVEFYKNNTRQTSLYTGCVAYINKSIAKNTVANFSINIPITKSLWNHFAKGFEDSPYYLVDCDYCIIQRISFDLWPSAASSGTAGTSLDGDTYHDNVPDNVYQNQLPTDSSKDFIRYGYALYLKQPLSPQITFNGLTDRANPSALTVFDKIIPNYSLPKLGYSWTLDPKYPKQNCAHALNITGAITASYTYSSDADMATYTTNWNLPMPTTSGTVYWSYTVTDYLGTTSTITGNFEVFAYILPTISSLLLERWHEVQTSSGTAHEAADDGNYLWLSLEASIMPLNNSNAYTAVMTFWESSLGESTATTVTSEDGWTLGGSDGGTISLTRDELQLAGIFVDDAKNYTFKLVITDFFGFTAVYTSEDIVKAGAVLDVSPGGVGVGMRCTGTEGGGELFQCAYPARFASEVIGSDYTFTKTSGNANVNRILAQRSGSVVNIELRVALTAATSAGSNIILGTLSGGPLPSIGITTAAAFNGSSVAVLSITPNGEITVRAIAASYGSNGATAYWRFMFLTND